MLNILFRSHLAFLVPLDIFKIFEIMTLILLYCSLPSRNNTFRQQKFDLIYPKVSVELNELNLFV